MTQKDDPELVTSGPYRLVRHPIYSGILVAGAGTAVALGWIWLAAVAQHYLSQRFPHTYPRYKNSTKMLLPYLF